MNPFDRAQGHAPTGVRGPQAAEHVRDVRREGDFTQLPSSTFRLAERLTRTGVDASSIQCRAGRGE